MPHCPAAGEDGLTVSGRAEGVSPLPPATPSWPKPGAASAPRGAHWEGGRSPGPFSRLPFHFGPLGGAAPGAGTLGAGRSAHGPRVGEPRGVRSSSTPAGEGCDLRRPRQGPWSPATLTELRVARLRAASLRRLQSGPGRA